MEPGSDVANGASTSAIWTQLHHPRDSADKELERDPAPWWFCCQGQAKCGTGGPSVTSSQSRSGARRRKRQPKRPGREDAPSASAPSTSNDHASSVRVRSYDHGSFIPMVCCKFSRSAGSSCQREVAPCVGAGGKDFIIYCNKYIRVTNSFAGLPSQTGACRATATTSTKMQ